VARADRRQRRRRWARAAVGWAPVVLVLATFGAATASYHYDLGTRWFGAPAAAPATPPAPGLTLPSPSPLRPVARPAPSSRPAAVAVRRALAQGLANPALARLRAVVAPLSGPALLDRRHGSSMPASTLKLLTTSAALHVLGPEQTFATRVVAEGRHSITLVGGGDPFLADRAPKAGSPADASLQSLARRTADRLRARGVTRVRLAYDASLFTGPRVNPRWPAGYVTDQVVSPITALWADEGVAADGSRRVTDPAATAAADFAAYLTKDGVRVDGAPRDRDAHPGARELARVASVPLSDIVERVLENSDNEGAEVLARQVGLAVTGEGSFAGGVRAVEQTLRGLGIDLHGARVYDGSGLSRDDRLDAATLVQVLQLAASPDHPELRPVLTGLPVASFTGSLQGRFEHSTGRGWVRAKTGTLSGTSALAGIATDASGRVLVFAFVSNHIPEVGTLDARAALDHLAAALAACRC
jgi:D-alanyl-D-alanine carboxypeptidase/D-alanyl-D-alanine-endopeptidase (penicillin-binding protein 4)